jgi:caffeoyl-CoA O-methyltransferase
VAWVFLYVWPMPNITDPQIEAYATAHTAAEPQLLEQLAAETRRVTSMPQMMVGQLEGRFLKMLVAAVSARRVLEIGTFTGYSALSMAEALPADGRLVTCELDPRHAEIAQSWFDRSPFGERIELRLGPALDTLRSLDGPFDFVFIDADKTGYADYYQAVLPLLGERGLICVDNVLRGGGVLDPASADEGTRAIIEFNEMVARDPRVECVMVPIRDGVSLIRRV